MIVEAGVSIQAPKTAVWAAMTDFDRAAQTLRGIEKLEIVERPDKGLVGLRWRETRLYFGELATVEKTITAASENGSYQTRARSDGFLFLSTMRLAEHGGVVTLTSIHETRPEGFVARLKATPMFLFRGAIRKALLEDLNDIKAAVEGGPARGGA